MYSIFKMFFKPILPVDIVTTPFAVQSSNSTVNMENIATMFNAFNTTAQTMIQMNSDYLATISRLSDDIGTMSERIGLMADKIEETEVLQSANFLSVQSNTTAVVGAITDSTIFTIMTSDVVSSMTIPTITTDYSMSNSELINSLFPTATNSNAALVASMVLSFSDTINSMIEVNTDYINTAIKLGNDVGKMTVRIGQMADKIVDTMAIQNANLTAITNTTGTTSTTSTTTTITTTTVPVVDLSLTTAAVNTSNTITGLTSSFSSTMNDIVTAANSDNNTVHGIVEMFMAANLIIRDMITLNTQFLTTVLSLSDEIGMMADRIGYMADEIVDIQKDFSPLYLSSHDISGTTDATQATLTASNGTLHTTADAINIYLDSINAVSSSSSLAMPFDLATVGDMTSLFISMIKGLANTDMGTINMDEVTSMFVTANETVQMMMGMNDQYLNAVLRLSDDIGTMADRIAVMADRIVETQEIQSENFLATYHDGVDLMLIGDASINTLTGGLGADTLDGKVGADTMIGGTGNDTYYVDNSLDTVIETSTLSTEIDTVKSSISYTLGSNVENLTLFGTATINGTGNTLNNVINGNTSTNILSGGAGNDIINGFEGADTLFGGAGNDTLTGGAGNDIFAFNTAINSFTNRDTITDFTSGADTIQLENAIFTKLTTTGTLSADNFAANVLGVATDFNDYIIYNTITGVLSYDADGIGIFHAPTVIALLGTFDSTITAADFTVI